MVASLDLVTDAKAPIGLSHIGLLLPVSELLDEAEGLA